MVTNGHRSSVAAGPAGGLLEQECEGQPPELYRYQLHARPSAATVQLPSEQLQTLAAVAYGAACASTMCLCACVCTHSIYKDVRCDLADCTLTSYSIARTYQHLQSYTRMTIWINQDGGDKDAHVSGCGGPVWSADVGVHGANKRHGVFRWLFGGAVTERGQPICLHHAL